jgi:hypothetical protein
LRWLAVALLVALLLRSGLFLINLHENAHYFRVTTVDARAVASDTTRPHLPFGYEPGNVARALVCSHQGLASPFGGNTGPSGWVAPGLVAVYAVGFALFGCYSLASLMFGYGFTLAMSLATTAVVAFLALEVFRSPRAAVGAGFLFAVAPYDFWQFSVRHLFDLDIVTFLFAFLLLLVVRYAKAPTLSRLAAFAVTSGLALLFFPGFIAPSVLTFVAALLVSRPQRWARHLALWTALQILVVGPYILVQRHRLGGWTFVKSNAPFELYLGNVPGAHGLLTDDVYLRFHPGHSPVEYRRYAKAGELPYVKEKFGEFTREFEPGRFARDTANRFLHFFFLYTNETDGSGPWVRMRQLLWLTFGLTFVAFFALRRGRPRGLEWLIYLQTAGFALPYMLAGVTPRYRVPITPAVVLLAAGSLLVIADHIRQQRRRAVAS